MSEYWNYHCLDCDVYHGSWQNGESEMQELWEDLSEPIARLFEAGGVEETSPTRRTTVFAGRGERYRETASRIGLQGPNDGAQGEGGRGGSQQFPVAALKARFSRGADTGAAGRAVGKGGEAVTGVHPTNNSMTLLYTVANRLILHRLQLLHVFCTPNNF